MKKLTRMKLINWHRFNNCTIEFGDSTLLSGENGAGKSTLLDAIQFVIICSTGYFNKAAHENGKRRLTGYIRCKTGKKTSLMSVPARSALMLPWNFMRKARINILLLVRLWTLLLRIRRPQCAI
ncbi:MAG: ATP-binding protein [Ruminococcus sp.]